MITGNPNWTFLTIRMEQTCTARSPRTVCTARRTVNGLAIGMENIRNAIANLPVPPSNLAAQE